MRISGWLGGLVFACVACGGGYEEAAAPSKPEATAAGSGCANDGDCKEGRRCVGATPTAGGTCRTPTLSAETEARISSGDLSVPILGAVLDSGVCQVPPGLMRKLLELKNPAAQQAYTITLAPTIVENDPQLAYGVWLVLVDRFFRKCNIPMNREDLAQLSGSTGAWVPEGDVERATDSGDCGTLSAVHTMNLWPYERRFLGEISKRDFTAAEITRRIWRETLDKFKANCSKRLNRREEARLDGSLEKINRIIGLDDPLLIELRSKLMAALERNDAASASSYMLAVSNREKVLDEHNAAVYEAKARSLQSELSAANAKPAAEAVAAARNDKPAAAKGDALDDVNRGIDTTHKAVETVDYARKVFGF